jgi:hypothetical protein
MARDGRSGRAQAAAGAFGLDHLASAHTLFAIRLWPLFQKAAGGAPSMRVFPILP